MMERPALSCIFSALLLLLLLSASTGNPQSRKGFFLNHDAFSVNKAKGTSLQLGGLMRVHCGRDHMLVSFSLVEMVRLGILPNQISLKDRKCVFRSNITHYFVKALFKGMTCSSVYSQDNVTHVHNIDNSVMVIPPSLASQANQILLDDEDAADVDMASGSGDGEVIQVNIIELPFLCEYQPSSASKARQPPASVSAARHLPLNQSQPVKKGSGEGKLSMRPKPLHYGEGNSSFVMELFDKSTLLNPLLSNLLSIPVGTLLYVQIKPQKNGPYQKSFLHSCYYHSAVETLDQDLMYLIRNGCPVHPSVTFLDDHRGQEDRLFSFKVQKICKKQTSLRCELEPCSLVESKHSSLRQCASQMSYCSSKPLPTSEQVNVTWPYNLLVTEDNGAQQLQENVNCKEQLTGEPCDCPVDDRISRRQVQTTSVGEKQLALKTWMVGLIVGLAFFIGFFSVLGLWYIHNRTHPQPKMTAIPVTEPDPRPVTDTSSLRL